ncbi:MAG: hypothetical protein LZF86_60011 [Nitrospira sp.]|nr:MAG: hypothetical protein LZF86_60011 [Nitrospira sp.]
MLLVHSKEFYPHPLFRLGHSYLYGIFSPHDLAYSNVTCAEWMRHRE